MHTIHKITPELGKRLAVLREDEEIDFVVEMEPMLVRSSPKEMKRAFIDATLSVAITVHQHGARILALAWINETVLARGTIRCIEELTVFRNVNSIDIPKRINREDNE